MGCYRPGETCNEYNCGNNNDGKCYDRNLSAYMDRMKKLEAEVRKNAIEELRQEIYDKAWLSAADQKRVDEIAERLMES